MVPASQAAVGHAVDFVRPPLKRALECRLRRGLQDEEGAWCRSRFVRAHTGAGLRAQPKSITGGRVGRRGTMVGAKKYAVPKSRGDPRDRRRGNTGTQLPTGVGGWYPAVMTQW